MNCKHCGTMRWLTLLLLLHIAQADEKTSLPDANEAAYPAIERFVKVLEQVSRMIDS
jgi:hypothetical protein